MHTLIHYSISIYLLYNFELFVYIPNRGVAESLYFCSSWHITYPFIFLVFKSKNGTSLLFGVMVLGYSAMK